MTIKEMRELLGLSQEAFATMYGIPKRTIENWEQGKRQCPPYVLSLLEKVVKADYATIELSICQSIPKNEKDVINNRFL